MLTFGSDLWDQLPTIESYTGEGIKLLDDCSEFFRERARMEAEHARSLQKLTNTYLPSARKTHHKKDVKETDTASTTANDSTVNSSEAALENEAESRLRNLKQNTLVSAWYTILQQSRQQADEQERLANELSDSVTALQKTFLREKEQERKQLLSEANELKDGLKKHYKNLEKSKAVYDRKKKKADDAKLVFEKYQRDVNTSENSLNKSRDALTRRNDKALTAETNYQNQLVECNQAQEDFFKRAFPEKLNIVQQLEEARIDHMKETLTGFVATTQRGNAVNQSCYDQMLSACENINRDIDLQSFIATNKSGEPMPGLIGFQPFNPSLGISGSYGAYGFLVKPGENTHGSAEWQNDAASVSSMEDNLDSSRHASQASLKALPAAPSQRLHIQQLPSQTSGAQADGNDAVHALSNSYAQQSLANQA